MPAHSGELEGRIVRGLRALSVLARTTTGKELRERLVEDAKQFFDADAVALWRLESRERLWRISAATGLSDRYPSLTIAAPTPAEVASMLPGPRFVPDVNAWPAVDDRREIYEKEGLVSLLVLPLNIRGETAGTITCYYRTRRASMSELEMEAAGAFAEIASVAVSNERFDQVADVARDVAGRLDLEGVVQRITDAATTLTGAQFGAFFYNVVRPDGESYTLYTISGVAREHFEKFPMPRNTAVFRPTFVGSGIVRSDDIRKDPRYGKNPPYHGMPAGHLPVVSYLAVPVISRNGEVLGGLFFGHAKEGIFGETEEKVAEALAGHAAVSIDNVRVYARLEHDRSALRKEERRYRSLVTATPGRQALAVMSPDGRTIQDSPTWREITGQTPEDVASRGWVQAVHPTQRDYIVKQWGAAVAARKIFEEEYLLRQSDGSYRWFAGKAVPVFDDEGVLDEWIGTAVDIHEQHVAQDILRFLARASELFATSLDYRETLRNLTQLAVPTIADWCAVDVVDSNGEKPRERLAVAHVDPAKVAMAADFQKRFPPDPSTDLIGRVIATGKSELIPFVSDEMLMAGAGSSEHLEAMRQLGIMAAMVVPLRSRSEVMGAIMFVASDRRYDEHDLQNAEELAHRASIAIENARLYTAAQAANRAKDEFLATLSHELRTPMTAVLGWSRMLKLGLNEEETQLAIDAIEQSASAQAQLIEDVLDVSRIMSGKLTFDPHPVDVGTVAQAAIGTVHPTAVAKAIEILTSIPPDVPQVAGDEGRLQQIIWNLLANAIKFTPRGGAVTLRVTHDNANVHLVVSDNGEGIEPSFLPYVFEPFRQADSSPTRPHGGIGLGLAIVRSLVEMHGGRIRVDSTGKGRGATFTIELPAMGSAPAAVDRAPLQSRRMAATDDNEMPSLEGLSVLVVDDQEYTRDVIAAILRRSGAKPQTARSVREGLAVLHGSPFDVVVCDIAMPEEDGYVFLRELRSRPEGQGIPILALTAFGRPEDRAYALKAGFDAYLKKPVDPPDLARAVQQLAARRVKRA